MSDGRRQRAEEIALAARRLGPTERTRFLVQACGKDEVLLGEVEELLGEPSTGSSGEAAPHVVPGVDSTIRSHLRRLGKHPESATDVEGGASGAQPDLIIRKAYGNARYVFKGEVGRGGMGSVLKVYDTDLRRDLAMKVILGKGEPGEEGATATSPLVVERFLEEAQVTGQLEHPGVVPVHELGVDGDGRMYFTMRLVRGKSFDEVIRLARNEEQGWNRTRALHSLLKICETVAYAHSRRVIHRDLKPSNIMIGRFGETYVMDWGAARILGRKVSGTPSNPSDTFASVRTDRRDQVASGNTPSATQEGMIIGTPFFMPREQAAGLQDEIGPHSDVYSVGCMLYQLMSGLRPYELSDGTRTVMEVVSLVISGPPEPLRKLAADAPAELVAICEKAMEHDWRKRYPDMLQMAEDLRAFLERRVVRAYQTGQLARFQKWVSRNRALATSIAASVLLALTTLTVVVVQQGRTLSVVKAEQRRTAEARDLAEQRGLEAERNAERAWREGYVANVIAADASLRANEVQEAKRLLAESRAELRGWEWHHLLLESDSSLRTLAGHTDRVLAVVYDHDGRRIASSSADGTVRVWDALDGKELFSLPGQTNGLVSVSFSPDGQRLFTFGGWADATMRTWDATTGVLLSAMTLPEGPASPVAVDGRGARLAFATTDNVVHVVDATTGQRLQTLEGHEGVVSALVFVPDADELLTASGDGTARLWDVSAGKAIRSFEGDDGGLFALDLQPAGRELVTGAENGVVRRWPIGGGRSSVLTRHQQVVYGVSYDRIGERVASVSFDKTVRVVELESAALTELRGHDEPVHCLAFSPDGHLLATGSDDHTLRLWDTRGGQAVRVQRGPEDSVAAVAVDPGGRRFALGAQFGGAIEIYDKGGGQSASIPGADDPVNDLAFSSDSRWLAAAHEEEACVRIYTCAGANPELVRTLKGHESSVKAVAFRPGAAELASGSSDYSVVLWSVEEGQRLRAFEGHAAAIADVAFDPAGELLAAASVDGTVLVWDADTAAEVRRLAGHPGGAYALAWSPDGHRLVVGAGDSDLWLWGSSGDAPVAVLAAHDQKISAVAFSPDGTRIVSGSYDASLRIWDAVSYEPLLSLRGHEQAVSSVAFSPDGDSIVSGSWDDTMRVWRTR